MEAIIVLALQPTHITVGAMRILPRLSLEFRTKPWIAVAHAMFDTRVGKTVTIPPPLLSCPLRAKLRKVGTVRAM